jgi:hypothetical protein
MPTRLIARLMPSFEDGSFAALQALPFYNDAAHGQVFAVGRSFIQDPKGAVAPAHGHDFYVRGTARPRTSKFRDLEESQAGPAAVLLALIIGDDALQIISELAYDAMEGPDKRPYSATLICMRGAVLAMRTPWLLADTERRELKFHADRTFVIFVDPRSSSHERLKVVESTRSIVENMIDAELGGTSNVGMMPDASLWNVHPIQVELENRISD